MKEISLHILDIAENSISAGATKITIVVKELIREDRLKITIEDNGCGVDKDMIEKILDPFTTSRTTRKVGLGIPLFKEAAEACNGFLEFDSVVGKGTRVHTEFQYSHIDRMPIGDLTSTFECLFFGTPQIHWLFKYFRNDYEFIFDSKEITDNLEGISLNDPDVLRFIREFIREGLGNTTLNNQPS